MNSRERFAQELQALRESDHYRERSAISSPQGTRVITQSRSLLSFCSNDYLGLANHPIVVDAFANATRRYGVGSGSSQLISGYTEIHEQLEEQLATFFRYPRVVLFSTGYMANLAVINLFKAPHTRLVHDRLNHASLLDATQLADIPIRRYQHCDVNHAKKLLCTDKESEKVLVTEGVFSMQGSIAPLPELTSVAEKAKAMLVVDDAHGVGVLGKTGRGSTELTKLDANQVPILVGTFGKAFGTFGAFVACDEVTAEYLIQKSRSLIYTTAPPAAIAAATNASLEIIKTQPERREKIRALISLWQKRMSDSDLVILPSQTPIQGVLLKTPSRALYFSQKLRELDILVSPIRPPTVAKDTARLRITLCATHQEEDVLKLADALDHIAATETK